MRLFMRLVLFKLVGVYGKKGTVGCRGTVEIKLDPVVRIELWSPNSFSGWVQRDIKDVGNLFYTHVSLFSYEMLFFTLFTSITLFYIFRIIWERLFWWINVYMTALSYTHPHTLLTHAIIRWVPFTISNTAILIHQFTTLSNTVMHIYAQVSGSFMAMQ